MTYKEQIRSPQWIEFATRFKKSKGWQCEACGASQSPSNELSVHHIYYVSGMKMWEHPESVLECLCSPCHKRRQDSQQRLILEFAQSLNIRRRIHGAQEPEAVSAFDEGGWESPCLRELEPAFPPGGAPYPEYPEHFEKWSEVVNWLSDRYPLQSGYLFEAMFAGLNSDGVLELRFRAEQHLAAQSLMKAATIGAISKKCREVFPGFDSVLLEVLDEDEEKRPAPGPIFAKIRQMLS